MLEKIKESKLTYLSIGVVAGLVLAYVYVNYLKKTARGFNARAALVLCLSFRRDLEDLWIFVC